MDALSFGAILVTIVLWASAFAGIRAGLADFSPAHLTLYRFLVACAALGLYAVVARLRPPPWRDLARILGLSLLGITTYHLALNFGEISVPAGTASLIIAAGPVITALLATALCSSSGGIGLPCRSSSTLRTSWSTSDESVTCAGEVGAS